jgi:hypothetical protein
VSPPLSRRCSGSEDEPCIGLELVEGETMPRSYPVLTTGNCIMVSVDWLLSAEAWFSRPESAGGMDVAPTFALAVILLHELGHVNGVTERSPTIVSELDLILGNERAHREIAADIYAAQQLRRAQESAASMSTAIEISLTVGHISWNLLGNRLLDNFGATTLALPHVFADRDLSHPNMELRFLVVSYVLNPSDAARVALAEFVAARARPRNQALYRSPEQPLLRRQP